MLAADVMTRNPATVAPDVHVLQAMEDLTAAGVRRLPVVDHDGQLVGLVTEADLASATPRATTAISLYDLNYQLATLLVRDVMATQLVTIAHDAPIEQAAVLLEAHRISGLPVLQDGQLAGIVTITDLLRTFIGFLGAREGGVRVTVEVPDEPGVLARVAQAAPPNNIHAAVTSGVLPGATRHLVLRVKGPDAAAYATRLADAGVRLLDVREEVPT